MAWTQPKRISGIGHSGRTYRLTSCLRTGSATHRSTSCSSKALSLTRVQSQDGVCYDDSVNCKNIKNSGLTAVRILITYCIIMRKNNIADLDDNRVLYSYFQGEESLIILICLHNLRFIFPFFFFFISICFVYIRPVFAKQCTIRFKPSLLPLPLPLALVI